MGVTKTCPQCGIQFYVPTSLDKHYTYCSIGCRHEAKQKVEKECVRCGQKFYVKQSESYRIYCSMKCYHSNRSVTVYTYTCEQCGSSFESKKQNRKYCCKQCAAIAITSSVIKFCAYCGKEFSTIPSKDEETICCSGKCSNALRRKNAIVIKVCPVCQKEFTHQKYFPNTTYCSNQCRSKARTTKVFVNCAHCGKEFSTPKHRKNKAKFCSTECWKAAISQILIEKICPVCNETFQLEPSKIDQSCCSRKCANKFKKRTRIEVRVKQWLDGMDVPFIEQQHIGPYTCDFALIGTNLVIESDGTYWHSLPKVIESDRKKDAYLENSGFHVLRLSEEEIMKSPEACIERIVCFLQNG